jgi:hypothetical protein
MKRIQVSEGNSLSEGHKCMDKSEHGENPRKQGALTNWSTYE